MQRLLVKDKGAAGATLHPMVIEWRSEITLTLRSLIAERVRLEFERQRDEAAAELVARQLGTADRKAKGLKPLVDADMLRRLNPYAKGPDPRDIPPPTVEDAVAHALSAFARNAFFIVVDGRQIEHLDEQIPFRPTSEVTFLRLVPLIGG